MNAMKMTKSRQKAKQVLEKLHDINVDKSLTVNKYLENTALLYDAIKQSGLTEYSLDAQMQNIDILQNIIGNKNKIIKQYAGNLGGIK